MVIMVDTREKQHAIEGILKYFSSHNIKTISSKMYVGDYCDYFNPEVVVDRKQSIREIASNCTTEIKRFEAEIKRYHEIGGRIVFLITENKIDGKDITSLEDVMLWQPKEGQGTVSGMTVYKKLAYLKNKYHVDFQFCSKRDAGKRIVEILNEG